MIIFAVELDKYRLKVKANALKDNFHIIQDHLREHITPIFSHKDQMNMEVKNTVSTVPNIIEIIHRPKYNMKHENPQAAH